MGVPSTVDMHALDVGHTVSLKACIRQSEAMGLPFILLNFAKCSTPYCVSYRISVVR